MSLHRILFIALTALFVDGMTSAVLAECGTCGAPAPVVYAQPLPVYDQPAPVYAPPVALAPAVAPVPIAPAPIAVDHWDTAGFGGCGGFGRCGGFGGCGLGGCGGFGYGGGYGNCGGFGRCGGFGGCASFGGCAGFAGCGGFGACGGFGGCGCNRSTGYVQPTAPPPIYVVNQGPEYSGPGITIPYQTYSPPVATGFSYPYIAPRYFYPGPGYHRYRFAHRGGLHVHPRYRPGHYWRS
jgi:hypothetical protein